MWLDLRIMADKPAGYRNHLEKCFSEMEMYLKGQKEGYCEKNVIATYLHGPLLSKNPKLADHILRSCLQHHTDQPVVLQPLDDALENACHDILCARLLKKRAFLSPHRKKIEQNVKQHLYLIKNASVLC